MKSMAIVGAAGFVGVRLVEALVLSGRSGVTAIVRGYRSLARLCRFGTAIEVGFADATDVSSLTRVLSGHSVAVNLVAGDADQIRASTRAIVEACEKARVERLIHLSSAVVYGTLETPGIDDDSPPLPRSRLWFPYAQAKAESELFLRNHSRANGPEIIVLRPGIVWGPKSRWIAGAADDLKHGAAFLIGDGAGICNSLYVDNLVACILTAAAHPHSAAGFYNVSDQERITWRDYYAALAPPCGCDLKQITRVPADRFRPTLAMRLEQLRETTLYGRLKNQIPEAARARIKNGVSRLLGAGSAQLPASAAGARPPLVSREMWDLQKVAYKLPNSKFRNQFGFEPPVSFAEGMRRSVAWLRFIGLVR